MWVKYCNTQICVHMCVYNFSKMRTKSFIYTCIYCYKYKFKPGRGKYATKMFVFFKKHLQCVLTTYIFVEALLVSTYNIHEELLMCTYNICFQGSILMSAHTLCFHGEIIKNTSPYLELCEDSYQTTYIQNGIPLSICKQINLCNFIY